MDTRSPSYDYNFAQAPYTNLIASNPNFSALTGLLQMGIQSFAGGKGIDVFGLNSSNIAQSAETTAAYKKQFHAIQEASTLNQAGIAEAMRGFSYMLGNGWGKQQQLAAESYAKTATAILPYVNDLLPGSIARGLFGKRGNAQDFLSAIIPYSEMTGDQMVGGSRWDKSGSVDYGATMWRDLYQGNNVKERLLDSKDMGDLFQWSHKVGRLQNLSYNNEAEKQNIDVLRRAVAALDVSKFDNASDRVRLKQLQQSVKQDANFEVKQEDLLSSLSSKGVTQMKSKIQSITHSSALKDMEGVVKALSDYLGADGSPSDFGTTIDTLSKFVGDVASYSKGSMKSKVDQIVQAGRLVGLNTEGTAALTQGIASITQSKGLNVASTAGIAASTLGVQGSLQNNGMKQGWGAQGINELTATAADSIAQMQTNQSASAYAAMNRFIESGAKLKTGSEAEKWFNAMKNGEAFYSMGDNGPKVATSLGKQMPYLIGMMAEGLLTEKGESFDSRDITTRAYNYKDNAEWYNNNASAQVNLLAQKRNETLTNMAIWAGNSKIGQYLTDTSNETQQNFIQRVLDVSSEASADLSTDKGRGDVIRKSLLAEAKTDAQREKINNLTASEASLIYDTMRASAKTFGGGMTLEDMSNLYSSKALGGSLAMQRQAETKSIIYDADRNFQMTNPVGNFINTLQSTGGDVSPDSILRMFGAAGFKTPEGESGKIIKDIIGKGADGAPNKEDVDKLRKRKDELTTQIRGYKSRDETVPQEVQQEYDQVSKMFDEDTGVFKLDRASMMNYSIFTLGSETQKWNTLSATLSGNEVFNNIYGQDKRNEIIQNAKNSGKQTISSQDAAKYFANSSLGITRFNKTTGQDEFTQDFTKFLISKKAATEDGNIAMGWMQDPDAFAKLVQGFAQQKSTEGNNALKAIGEFGAQGKDQNVLNNIAELSNYALLVNPNAKTDTKEEEYYKRNTEWLTGNKKYNLETEEGKKQQKADIIKSLVEAKKQQVGGLSGKDYDKIIKDVESGKLDINTEEGRKRLSNITEGLVTGRLRMITDKDGNTRYYLAAVSESVSEKDRQNTARTLGNIQNVEIGDRMAQTAESGISQDTTTKKGAETVGDAFQQDKAEKIAGALTSLSFKDRVRMFGLDAAKDITAASMNGTLTEKLSDKNSTIGQAVRDYEDSVNKRVGDIEVADGVNKELVKSMAKSSSGISADAIKKLMTEDPNALKTMFDESQLKSIQSSIAAGTLEKDIADNKSVVGHIINTSDFTNLSEDMSSKSSEIIKRDQYASVWSNIKQMDQKTLESTFGKSTAAKLMEMQKDKNGEKTFIDTALAKGAFSDSIQGGITHVKNQMNKSAEEIIQDDKNKANKEGEKKQALLDANADVEGSSAYKGLLSYSTLHEKMDKASSPEERAALQKKVADSQKIVQENEQRAKALDVKIQIHNDEGTSNTQEAQDLKRERENVERYKGLSAEDAEKARQADDAFKILEHTSMTRKTIGKNKSDKGYYGYKVDENGNYLDSDGVIITGDKNKEGQFIDDSGKVDEVKERQKIALTESEYNDMVNKNKRNSAQRIALNEKNDEVERLNAASDLASKFVSVKDLDQKGIEALQKQMGVNTFNVIKDMSEKDIQNIANVDKRREIVSSNITNELGSKNIDESKFIEQYKSVFGDEGKAREAAKAIAASKANGTYDEDVKNANSATGKAIAEISKNQIQTTEEKLNGMTNLEELDKYVATLSDDEKKRIQPLIADKGIMLSQSAASGAQYERRKGDTSKDEMADIQSVTTREKNPEYSAEVKASAENKARSNNYKSDLWNKLGKGGLSKEEKEKIERLARADDLLHKNAKTTWYNPGLGPATSISNYSDEERKDANIDISFFDKNNTTAASSTTESAEEIAKRVKEGEHVFIGNQDLNQLTRDSLEAENNRREDQGLKRIEKGSKEENELIQNTIVAASLKEKNLQQAKKESDDKSTEAEDTAKIQEELKSSNAHLWTDSGWTGSRDVRKVSDLNAYEQEQVSKNINALLKNEKIKALGITTSEQAVAALNSAEANGFDMSDHIMDPGQADNLAKMVIKSSDINIKKEIKGEKDKGGGSGITLNNATITLNGTVVAENVNGGSNQAQAPVDQPANIA